MQPYQPLHPDLYELRESDLDPGFRAALRVDAIAQWSEVLVEVQPRVYALRVLTLDWCQRLLGEALHIEAWCARNGVEIERPNSMNDHGLILDEHGFAPALGRLVGEALRPLAAHLYPDLGGASLDEHHAFVVDYALDKDLDLGFHVDDSEVTLNLCLGDTFVGSSLFLRGMRCEGHRQTHWSSEEARDFEHQPGVAVLHAGKQRHGVHPLLSGRRRNLILWCRSSTYRASLPSVQSCAEWCGARVRRRPHP